VTRWLPSLVSLMLALAVAMAAPLAAQTPAMPTEVKVSVHINDIQQVSLRSHSFYADIYVGFRWRDPDLAPVKTLTWMNPYQLWAHVSRPMTDGPRRLPDGDLFEWVRQRGEFNVALPLHNYPFDRQLLVAEFADRAMTSSRMIYVMDKVTIAHDINLPGYDLGVPRLSLAHSEDLGAVDDLSGPPREDFAHVRIEVPISRPWLPYAVKLLLPLFIATGCAALMFLVPPQFVEARMGLGITSVLILVALQLTLNADLPEVDYLMMLDKLYLAGYLFDFAAIAMVAWSTTRYLHDLAGSRIRALDRRIIAGLGAGYVALVVLALTTSGA
jgi:hypothetical protein